MKFLLSLIICSQVANTCMPPYQWPDRDWETRMTDMSKYKNVSLTKETYKILESLSKVLLPDAKLSISKTIEAIANEKAKKLNGKIKGK